MTEADPKVGEIWIMATSPRVCCIPIIPVELRIVAVGRMYISAAPASYPENEAKRGHIHKFYIDGLCSAENASSEMLFRDMEAYYETKRTFRLWRLLEEKVRYVKYVDIGSESIIEAARILGIDLTSHPEY